jgi:hypothetical protein
MDWVGIVLTAASPFLGLPLVILALVLGGRSSREIEKLKIRHDGEVSRLIAIRDAEIVQLQAELDRERRAQARTNFKLGWSAAMKKAAGVSGPYRSNAKPPLPLLCESCAEKSGCVQD